MKTFKTQLLAFVLLLGTAISIHAQGVSASFQLLPISAQEGAAEDEITTTATTEILNEISSHLVYPTYLEEFNIKGTSHVKVKIDQEGKIISRSIVKSIGKAFDEAILKSIKNLKSVSPVYINGEAMDYSIVVPVRFEL